MKTQDPSFRSFALKSVLLIGMVMLLMGCCRLGITCYDLLVYGEPALKDADIYLDNKLIKSSVSGSIHLYLSEKKHEIKVIQKDFKPFIAVLEAIPEGRSEQTLGVKFEPINSLRAIPSSPFHTAKSVK